MFRASRRTAAVATAVVAVAAAGTAVAAGGSGPTTVTVDPSFTVGAGAKAPFDAPGVQTIRAGKPIPAGFVLVGRRVTVHRGANAAGAAIHMFCPGGKRLRTFGITGHAGFQSTSDYVGRRSALIVSLPDGRRIDSSGTVYAVCR